MIKDYVVTNALAYLLSFHKRMLINEKILQVGTKYICFDWNVANSMADALMIQTI